MPTAIAIDIGIFLALISLSYFGWRKYNDKALLRYVHIGLAGIVITVWQFISASVFELGGLVQVINLAMIQILRLLALALLIAMILKRRQ
jgi:hypothetical protein